MAATAKRMIALLSVGLASGCWSGGQGGRGTDVEIDGSSTVYPLSEAVAEEIRTAHPEIRVTVAKKGTGGGMERFSAGEIDICDASREMTKAEAELCAEAGVRFDRFPIAYDGIAVCVNPKNDWCDGLTVEQLKEIFRLDSPIQKWSDLNPDWPDEEIKLFGPGADSGTFDIFKEEVLGEDTKSRTGYTQSEEDMVLVNGVKADERALGYFGFSYYVENTDGLKVLGINAGDGGFIKPTNETISNNTYVPLSRPLYIYVNLDSFQDPKVANFVKFYLDNAAELANDVNHVPVGAEITADNQAKFKELSSDVAKPVGG